MAAPHRTGDHSRRRSTWLSQCSSTTFGLPCQQFNKMMAPPASSSSFHPMGHFFQGLQGLFSDNRSRDVLAEDVPANFYAKPSILALSPSSAPEPSSPSKPDSPRAPLLRRKTSMHRLGVELPEESLKIADHIAEKHPHLIITDADIRRSFCLMDTNKDGTISEEEYEEAMKHLHVPPEVASATVKDLFHQFHHEEKPGLTFEEFRQQIRFHQQHILDLWMDFDHDGSGEINREDVFRHLCDRGVLSRSEINQIVSRLERRGGKVTWEEFAIEMLPLSAFKEHQIMDQYLTIELPVHGMKPVSSRDTLIAGFVAGAVSRTATAPMDRLRSLMAVGGSATLGDKPVGLLEGLQKMYKAGGVRAMWQGNGTNVVQVGPESALLFFFNAQLNMYIAENPASMTVLEKFLCGSAAGTLSMTMVYPMYVIQNRMLVAPEGHYKGLIDCVRQTVKHEGFKALTQGYLPSLIRIIPFKGLDMGGYYMLKELFIPPEEKITGFQSFLFGAAASAVSQTVTHPLLVIRTKLQTQGIGGAPIKYRGMRDAFMQTHAKNGLKGLMAGWTPSMAKNVPAIALQFAVCERMIQLLQMTKS